MRGHGYENPSEMRGHDSEMRGHDSEMRGHDHEMRGHDSEMRGQILGNTARFERGFGAVIATATAGSGSGSGAAGSGMADDTGSGMADTGSGSGSGRRVAWGYVWPLHDRSGRCWGINLSRFADSEPMAEDVSADLFCVVPGPV
jgi:hypothetical protein